MPWSASICVRLRKLQERNPGLGPLLEATHWHSVSKDAFIGSLARTSGAYDFFQDEILDADFACQSGYLVLRDAGAAAAQPHWVWQAFALYQARPEIVGFSADTLRTFYRVQAQIGADFCTDIRSRQAFLRAVQSTQLEMVSCLSAFPASARNFFTDKISWVTNAPL